MPDVVSKNITKIIDIANRMRYNQKRMEIIANNLANIDTVGYKRDITFTKVLRDNQHVTIKKKTEFDQGDLVNTDNPLDVAINGDAFFVVTDGENTYFTKNGKFHLATDGYLVDSDGMKVLGKGGEIFISNDIFKKEKEIKINQRGEITLGKEAIDQLFIAKVGNKDSLIKVGGSKFKLQNGFYDAADENEYTVMQGYLEESNVNPIMEMENMITMSKNFESIQKVIQNYDEVLGKANEIGKV